MWADSRRPIFEKTGSGSAAIDIWPVFRHQPFDSTDESGQKARQARQDEPEFVSGGGKQRVDLIAVGTDEVISSAPVIILSMTDHRLHR